jgi:hypothetical protein
VLALAESHALYQVHGGVVVADKSIVARGTLARISPRIESTVEIKRRPA